MRSSTKVVHCLTVRIAMLSTMRAITRTTIGSTTVLKCLANVAVKVRFAESFSVSEAPFSVLSANEKPESILRWNRKGAFSGAFRRNLPTIDQAGFVYRSRFSRKTRLSGPVPYRRASRLPHASDESTSKLF